MQIHLPAYARQSLGSPSAICPSNQLPLYVCLSFHPALSLPVQAYIFVIFSMTLSYRSLSKWVKITHQNWWSASLVRGITRTTKLRPCQETSKTNSKVATAAPSAKAAAPKRWKPGVAAERSWCNLENTGWRWPQRATWNLYPVGSIALALSLSISSQCE